MVAYDKSGVDPSARRCRPFPPCSYVARCTKVTVCPANRVTPSLSTKVTIPSLVALVVQNAPPANTAAVLELAAQPHCAPGCAPLDITARRVPLIGRLQKRVRTWKICLTKIHLKMNTRTKRVVGHVNRVKIVARQQTATIARTRVCVKF